MDNKGFTVNTQIENGQIAKMQFPKKTSKKQEFFEWLDVIVTALIAVVVIFSVFFRVATISGDSMLDTLHSGERVIISNLAYTPKQGDIVVVSRNINNTIGGDSIDEGPIIKRVIATENQTVDIDFETGQVFVDGIVLKEEYISSPTTDKRDIDFPVIVPKGCIFVLGDNRSVSLDSRSTLIGEEGMIDARYVLGRAVFRVFPFDKFGRLDEK